MFISGVEIKIPIWLFQQFDQRKIIEAPIPDGVVLNVGDAIWWNAAQLDGTCTIEEVCADGKTVKIVKCQ